MPVIPGPAIAHPMEGHPRVTFLKPVVTAPHIEVGDYSYYDDPDQPEAFQDRNVLYAYGPERLVIGRYCALVVVPRDIAYRVRASELVRA